MIPKLIHYCWFGGAPLPESAIKCIESWKTFFPDYEIREWNESNFDYQICSYTKKAYEEEKWAFVSDYARFWIVYTYGGVYFDTDVEIIRDMHDVVQTGPFMGCESIGNCAPGLGIAASSGNSIYKDILDIYENASYEDKKNVETVVNITSNVLRKYGWTGKNRIEKVEDIIIYPTDYFCPMDYYTGEVVITNNTRTIHHYDASWLNKYEKKMALLRRKCIKLFGDEIGYYVYPIVKIPYRVANKAYMLVSKLRKGADT